MHVYTVYFFKHECLSIQCIKLSIANLHVYTVYFIVYDKHACIAVSEEDVEHVMCILHEWHTEVGTLCLLIISVV